jgi:hypothetical protein
MSTTSKDQLLRDLEKTTESLEKEKAALTHSLRVKNNLDNQPPKERNPAGVSSNAKSIVTHSRKVNTLEEKVRVLQGKLGGQSTLQQSINVSGAQGSGSGSTSGPTGSATRLAKDPGANSNDDRTPVDTPMQDDGLREPSQPLQRGLRSATRSAGSLQRSVPITAPKLHANVTQGLELEVRRRQGAYAVVGQWIEGQWPERT